MLHVLTIIITINNVYLHAVTLSQTQLRELSGPKSKIYLKALKHWLFGNTLF